MMMESHTPVSFNSLKHHADRILRFLGDATEEEFTAGIDALCHNNNDLYTGRLTPEAICLSVVNHLGRLGVLARERYEEWIGSGGSYRQVTIEDGSEWILRKGEDGAGYVHIHPAKTGPFTIRFKGSTLKTVYCLLRNMKHSGAYPTLETVNRARTGAGLSPVKRLETGKGIHRCLVFFLLYRQENED